MSGGRKEMRLHEGELNVMELLWSNKVLAAKDISKIIKEYIKKIIHHDKFCFILEMKG